MDEGAREGMRGQRTRDRPQRTRDRTHSKDSLPQQLQRLNGSADGFGFGRVAGGDQLEEAASEGEGVRPLWWGVEVRVDRRQQRRKPCQVADPARRRRTLGRRRALEALEKSPRHRRGHEGVELRRERGLVPKGQRVAAAEGARPTLGETADSGGPGNREACGYGSVLQEVRV